MTRTVPIGSSHHASRPLLALGSGLVYPGHSVRLATATLAMSGPTAAAGRQLGRRAGGRRGAALLGPPRRGTAGRPVAVARERLTADRVVAALAAVAVLERVGDA